MRAHGHSGAPREAVRVYPGRERQMDTYSAALKSFGVKSMVVSVRSSPSLKVVMWPSGLAP